MNGADAEPADPLIAINAWLHRCRRYGRRANGQTIDVLALAVAEIELLRRMVIQLQGEGEHERC